MPDLIIYVPLALAMVASSFLIAKYPPLSLPKERVPSTLVIMNGAFVLFVVLDVMSGRALTLYTDPPKTAVVLLTALVVLACANLAYLLVRQRRAPR